MTRAIAAALAALALAAPAPAADETPAASKIVAVDLFKNGLAVVKREATLGKPGVYTIDDVPLAIHGTYFVESNGPVETVVKLREVEVPVAEATPGNLQDDLAGKKVTVYFKGGNRPPAVGTVMKLKPAKDDGGQPGRYLVLENGKHRMYIEASEVASVDAEDAADTVKRLRPRMLLTLGETKKAETKVVIHYLTRGAAWAPSYRIDITDPKTLALEQHAVVRNELSDLSGVEVRLISGFPSVQFSHVRSPLSPRTTLAGFFSELQGHGVGRDNNDFTGNTVVTQNPRFNAVAPDFPGLGAIPSGEGVDLHYQPIGKRTLADGDTLELTVAKGKADYERVVEWLVPDNRNEYGQYDGRGQGGDDDSAWDALRFKNPLPFPMTTGPATVTAGGEFNGQRTSYWVNAGEEMVLRVNKALSVRTRSVENEVQVKDGGREPVWLGGRQYRRGTVEGELAVGNHRNETVKVLIRRRFSGDLTRADGDPTSSLREEGVYSVNKRNQLLWTLSLKAGEERKIKYTYSVLIPF